MTKREIINEMGFEEAVFFDSPEYDEAIIGLSEEGSVVYDFEIMVDILVKRDGMTAQEAGEFIAYNTIRALPYAPEPKPVIMYHLWE